MTPEEVEALFTRDNGDFVFARWGRPIAPVAFGVKDETLGIIKGAYEAIAALAGHEMADTDPETGANCMLFFFKDWDELLEVPNLKENLPDLDGLVDRLKAADANQYRLFRFDDNDGIKSVFIFLRMGGDLADFPAETLLLTQAVQSILLWKDNAFNKVSAFEKQGDRAVLRTEIGSLIRAAYDPALPHASRDAATALRLHARMSEPQ